MDILQSDECFYNGTNTISKTFTTTLVIHIIFLSELDKILFVNFNYFIFFKSYSSDMVYYLVFILFI